MRQRMHHRWLLLSVLSGLSGVPGLAAASPSYASRLDDRLTAQAREDFVDKAKQAGIDEDKAERIFLHTVVATSRDTGCPGVDVDVVNPTDHTEWNVELEITQTVATVDHPTKIHLPYLPSHTVAHATVPCVTDYRSRYASDSGIGLSYFARGSDELEHALGKLRDEAIDYSYFASMLHPSSDVKTKRLVEALKLEDADVARELVFAIAKTGVGLEELSAEIASVPDGPIAKEVGAAIAKAPPDVQVGLARVLMSSPEAESSIAQLEPLIDRLCRGKRPEVVELWLSAQGTRQIPVARLRDRVKARCVLTPADGGVLAAALDATTANVGEVLDAAPRPLFDAVIAAWKARPEPAGRASYARDTHDAERFTRTVASIPPAGYPLLFSELIKATSDPVTAQKAQWAITALGPLTGPVADDVAERTTTALLYGGVTDPEMASVVRAARAKAPDKIRAFVAAFATAERSPMLDVGKLPASLDVAEVVGVEQRTFGCAKTEDALLACMKEVAAFPGLPAAINDAVRPAFLEDVQGVVRKIKSFDKLAELGKAMAAAGFTNKTAVAAACSLAEQQSAPEQWTEQIPNVEKVDPRADCIETRLRQVSRKYRSRAVWLWIFGLAGLILPFPAGAYVLRRRYRKLQQDLPKPEVEAAGQGTKLADRLGERGLGRGLRAAIGAAAADLAQTPAAHALASIDDAVLQAIGDTVGRAVKSGDAATLLLRHTPDALYIVALPVRHARPQIVQRYLGAPWPQHVAQIQRAAQTSVVSLVVLCGPEAAEARLVVGFTPAAGDPRPAFEPESLLDARDARERGAQPFVHVMSLGEA